MKITLLLGTMSSLFSALAVGFFGAKLKLIDQDFNRKLSKLLLALIHPCMILSSVLDKERLLSNGQMLWLIGLAVGCYIVLIPLSALLVRLLRIPKADWGTYRFMLVFSNVGFMGYPVAEALFGPDSAFHVTIFVLVFQFVSYSVGVNLISDGASPFRFDVRILLRPLVITALLALVIYITGYRVPAALSNMISYVGRVSTPLSMMIIGCSLAAIPLGQVVGNWRVYVLAGIKMIAIPLAACLLMRPFLREPMLLEITTVMLSMPVGTTATTMALAYGGNEKLASSGVFVTTILSLLTIPAILWLLFLQ